jgi:hypothetical protein
MNKDTAGCLAGLVGNDGLVIAGDSLLRHHLKHCVSGGLWVGQRRGNGFSSSQFGVAIPGVEA